MFNPKKRITMGKIKGLSPSKISGSVGNFTFRQTEYGTVVSEKIQMKENPQRTGKQAHVRMRMANLMRLFSMFGGTLRKGFEGSKNAINDFVKSNHGRYPVYLSKEEVAMGGCVVAPYQVTRGSLPAVELFKSGNVYRTDMALGDLVLSASTTIAQLTQAIVDHNDEYQHGDQIAYFVVSQYIDSNDVPRVVVRRQKLTLDLLNTNTIPPALLGYGFATVDGYLGQNAADTNFFYVHSRRANGGLKVSTQFIHVEDDTLYTTYGAGAAYTKAVNSYGGETAEVYLDPNSVVNVIYDGDDDEGIAPEGPTNVTITAQANDNVMGSVTGGGTYVQGASVTLTATPNEGYRFVQWSNGRTTASITVTAEADATFTATFAAGEQGGGGMDG